MAMVLSNLIYWINSLYLQIKNPCQQPIGNSVSGDIACRISEGNKCIPDLISGSYACQCLPNYHKYEFIDGPMAGKDNCAEQVDVCQKMRCQHGKCISVSLFEILVLWYLLSYLLIVDGVISPSSNVGCSWFDAFLIIIDIIMFIS